MIVVYRSRPLFGCMSVLSALGLMSATTSYADGLDVTSVDRIEEVVVSAHPLSAEKLAQPATSLHGDALRRAVSPSLAETLDGTPGISSSSFGAAVGRPVIRGLGGARVKTLEDRIDTMDVSVSSPDHATTVDPFIARDIEVLKGPSTLLYGTGAIGGVVDVHTGRIPHERPDELQGALDLRGDNNGDRRSAAGWIDGSAGSFAWHVDGFWRDADEYDIPGFAESAALRRLEEAEEEEHEEGEEHGEEEEAFGTLPGSQMESAGGAFGLSYVGERGFVGASVSRIDSEYGLPGGHGHEHEEGEEEAGVEEEEEEGNPTLDLEQTRIDIEAGLEAPFSGFKALNFRLGINDYEHTEFEPNGEPGSVFTNEAYEARVELTHEAWAGIDGAFGLQLSAREFSAFGEEAFVEPVDTDTVGVFYVGQTEIGSTGVEFGARLETVEHDPTSGRSRDFDLFAGSVGLIQPFGDGWTATAQFDLSSRAPVGEELYSDGPHLATQTFEVGDPDLDEERATNLSVGVAYEGEGVRFGVSAYVSDFSDFIFEAATGDEEDELPVFQWQQADARFRGAEVELAWDAASWDNGGLELSFGYDVVNARLDSGPNRNLPRIPPSSASIGALLDWNAFQAELTFKRVAEQDDVSARELATDSYDDLRLFLSYDFAVGGQPVRIFLSGRNLTDDEQRQHASFIKDFAPLPGRTIEAGVTIRTF